MKKYFHKKNTWLLVLILISLISLFGDVINDRFQMVDFEVYYRTADRMINQQEIYRIESDGHFVYKYAPSAAFFFTPFLIFGFEISKYLFWIGSTFLLAWGLSTLIQILKKDDSEVSDTSVNWMLFFSILGVIPHIHLEWHLGQVNIILMVVYIAIIKCFLEGKNKMGGVLLSLSLFIKPFGLIFLPYLILEKKWRFLQFFVLGFIVGCLLPFIFYPSFSQLSELYTSWLNELKIELSAKQNLFADGNHTIFSVIARFSPIGNFLDTESNEKFFQFFILGGMGILFLRYMSWGKRISSSNLGEMALLISWIPILAYTSQNAFIFSMPLIVFLIFKFSHFPLWMKILVALGCVLMGINMHDLVGNSIYTFLKNNSVYTFGSILLTFSAFYFRKMSIKKI